MCQIASKNLHNASFWSCWHGHANLAFSVWTWPFPCENFIKKHKTMKDNLISHVKMPFLNLFGMAMWTSYNMPNSTTNLASFMQEFHAIINYTFVFLSRQIFIPTIHLLLNGSLFKHPHFPLLTKMLFHILLSISLQFIIKNHFTTQKIF